MIKLGSEIYILQFDVNSFTGFNLYPANVENMVSF